MREEYFVLTAKELRALMKEERSNLIAQARSRSVKTLYKKIDQTEILAMHGYLEGLTERQFITGIPKDVSSFIKNNAHNAFRDIDRGHNE